VPLTNFAGWLVIAIVMIAALDRALPGAPAAAPARVELVPAAVLAWTWLGSTVGNLAFFDRPAVAVYGSLMMGATVLPYLLMLRHRLAGSAPAARPRPHPVGRR
jgi:putative membrane protein